MTQTNGSSKGWVTVRQLAEVLGVSQQGVWQSHVPQLAAEHVRKGNRHTATTVYGPAVVDLLVTRELRKRLPFDDDADTTISASNPEQRRAQLARAKLLELELCQRMKVLQPRAYWRELCNHTMTALRRLSTQVERWPAEFRDEYNEAVEEAHTAVIQHFGLDQDRDIDRVEFHIYLTGSNEPVKTILEPRRNEDETAETKND